MKWLILVMLLTVLPSGPIFSQAKHVLKKNETLFRISHIYNVSVQALMSVNYISDPRTLKEGMVLIIPDRYIVQKGETLYGIAREHGLSVEMLRNANGLSENHTLMAGESLIIPSEKGSEIAEQPVEKAEPDLADSAEPFWPHNGEREYQEGKLNGTHIFGKKGDPVKAIASGEVVWSGPYRGFGRVVLVQSLGGYVYVYGGNDITYVSVGETVSPGMSIGTLGINPHNGKASMFFSIFKDGKPVDPEKAPRG